MSAIDNQALGWLRLQAERSLDANEQALLDAWLDEDTRHRGAYIRANVINNAIAQAVAHQNLYPGEDRYGLRSEDGEGAGARRRALLKFGALAAGVAVLGVGVGTSLNLTGGSETVLATSKGEFKRVALPDTSFANINGGSKLEVKLTSDRRQVNLVQGEAWFEVAKDKAKPFVVQAGDVQVRAVGTAFGVRRYPDGAEVLVTEGTVEVWTGSAKARLTAGQHSFVPNRTPVIAVAQEPQEVQRKLAWRGGKLVFTRQTLGEAVADFNRYSTRKIIIADPALAGKRIFGQYQIDAPEQFAKDIGAYLNVPIEVRNGDIIIGAGGAPKDRNI
jgi:transmembrane sensor